MPRGSAPTRRYDLSQEHAELRAWAWLTVILLLDLYCWYGIVVGIIAVVHVVG